MDLVLESNKYNNEQKMKLIDDLNKLYSPSKKSKTSKRRNG